MFESVVVSKVRLWEEWGYERSKAKLRKEWRCKKNIVEISLLEHLFFFLRNCKNFSSFYFLTRLQKKTMTSNCHHLFFPYDNP
jgi:hypothetical protein